MRLARFGWMAWMSGLVLGASASVEAQSMTRVSVATAGTQANGESFVGAAAAGNGLLIAFQSSASNLVAGDTNGLRDIFVRNRVNSTTERVSVSSGGAEADFSCSSPSISDDGRYVAFDSLATTLASGDTNGAKDIFVRDRTAGTTERVSVDSSENLANGDSDTPVLSADGRYVVFRSDASNLVVGDANGESDIFVRDRLLGVTERVSVDSAEAEGDGYCDFCAISDDGNLVAFCSFSTNLAAGDTNGRFDIFVRDRAAGTTERVSVDSSEVEGNDHSDHLSISADGRYVAFDSFATNLVSGDTNAARDVFVRDRLSGTTVRVSVSTIGVQGNGASEDPSISSDGRYVAFQAFATNLVVADTNGWGDVFVRDTVSGNTERASLSSSGSEGNHESGISLSITPDGRRVAFSSRASNLVGGDTNAVVDVFLRDLDAPAGSAFCFPEIAGVRSCPCGNPPTSADLGCDSFITSSSVSGTGGAKLDSDGVPNASASTSLVFHVTGAHNPANNSNLHVFWKGTTTLAIGVKSGFGVRCVGGNLKRIYQGAGTGTGGLGSTNAVDFPNAIQLSDPWTVSGMPPAGTTLYYYDSFRDQQGPTTCNTANDRFNVSHALAVTWQP